MSRICGGTGGRLVLAAGLCIGAAGCGARSSSGTALEVEGGNDTDVRYTDREALPPPPKLSEGAADAAYLNSVAERLQPAWASFLEDCRVRLPASHELNNNTLSAELVLVMNSAGELLQVRASKTSGNEVFDQVALEISEDLGALPAPPVSRMSDDDRVYLHWTFARDLGQAGAATASWNRVDLPVAQALPKLLAGSQFAAATERVLASKLAPEARTGLLEQIAKAIVGSGFEQSDMALRVVALHSVGEAKLKDYLPQVRQAVRSSETDVAVAAIAALATVGEDADIELLLSLARGGAGTQAASAAASSLQRMGKEAQVASQATGDLSSPSEVVRLAALAALAKVQAPDAVGALGTIVLGKGKGKSKASRGERTAAALALGNQAKASPKALKTLIAGAGDGDASIRAACVGAIAVAASGGLQSRGAYFKAIELLRDRDERVRASAIRAAGHLDASRFAKELKGIRANGSKLVILSLAETLGPTPGPTALGRLMDLSAVPDEGMRIWAAKGLASRSEPKAKQALQTLLADSAASVRLAAISGVSDSEQLKGLLGDSSPEVQAAAMAKLTAKAGRSGTAGLLADTLKQSELPAGTRLRWVDAWLTSGE